jgi:four helix bundle protein
MKTQNTEIGSKGQGAGGRDESGRFIFLRAITTNEGDEPMNKESEKAVGTPKAQTHPAEARESGRTFENLEIWQDAITLATHVYERFQGCRDYEFRGQIRAASVSSNIAEGYERDSNAELIRFLFIAKGSCGEVRSQCHLAHRVKLLEETAANEMINESQRLSRRIQKLIDVQREKFS